MPVNLDSTNISNQANLLANTENAEVATIKTTIGIDNSQGIMGTSEAGATLGTTNSAGIPSLEAPDLPLEEVLDTVVKMDASTAQLLNVPEDAKMNITEFIKTVLDKIDSKFNKNSNDNTETSAAKDSSDSSLTSSTGGLDVSKMDAEALDLFCLLLTQSSKEKMIKTFKELLNAKIDERNTLQNKYNKELDEVTQKNVEAAEKAKAAERKAKKWGIFKAVLSAVVAVITTVAAVAVTALSFGSLGPVAMGFAIAGITCAVASCALTVVNSGITVAALCTEDAEKKATLNKWAMGIGIASAALGIAGALMSGGASFFSTATALSKIVSGVSSVVSGLSQVTTGAFDITEGTQNLKLAKLQKELADMKIDLTKLDADIELLNKLIDVLTNTSEDFIKNLLEGEQQAAKELINISDAQSNLAQEVPC